MQAGGVFTRLVINTTITANTSKVSAQTVVDDIMNYATQVTNPGITIGKVKESKLVAA